jgi:hypothetical protein
MKGKQQIDKWQKEEVAGVHSSCFWYRDAASVPFETAEEEWPRLAESMRSEMEAIETGSRSKLHDM